MLRYLTAAALAMVMTATTARATVVSGTWSFEVDAWPIIASPFDPPPPPVIGSATFSFDSGTTSPGDVLVPAGDFTSNFASPLATYFYDQTLDSLAINFAGSGFIEIQAQFNDVSTHLIEPSVPPMLQHVLFIPSLDESIAAADFSGGFAPAVPEPSTWVMLLLGFVGFGLAARRTGTIKKTSADAGVGGS
jgi:PEP-CTERM motif